MVSKSNEQQSSPNKRLRNQAATKPSGYETKRREFAALARTHETALVRAAVRLCRGQHDRTQDLAQDTLVRAYQAYLEGRFQHGPDVWPWLLRILTNLFINDLNHRKRWVAGLASTHAAPADVPGMDLMARLLDEELEHALALLPDTLRVCVLLCDMAGLSDEETAQILNIPIGTVRSRLAHARMKRHDLLQDFAKQSGTPKPMLKAARSVRPQCRS